MLSFVDILNLYFSFCNQLTTCIEKHENKSKKNVKKEYVIVGRLVPAGTGLTKIEWDKQAREQDKTRLEELKKQELESAPVAPEQTA